MASASILLHLTGDEAKTLFDVLACVEGDPATSRRRHIDEIAFTFAEEEHE